jgi:hypothetical protein
MQPEGLLPCSLEAAIGPCSEPDDSSGYEEYYLVGYNAVYSIESQPTFRRNISPPSLTLKNQICSSVTSVDFQRTTLRYIPQDSTPKVAYSFIIHLKTFLPFTSTFLRWSFRFKFADYVFMCVFIIAPMRATLHFHLILLHLTTRRVVQDMGYPYSAFPFFLLLSRIYI